MWRVVALRPAVRGGRYRAATAAAAKGLCGRGGVWGPAVGQRPGEAGAAEHGMRRAGGTLRGRAGAGCKSRCRLPGGAGVVSDFFRPAGPPSQPRLLGTLQTRVKSG